MNEKTKYKRLGETQVKCKDCMQSMLRKNYERHRERHHPGSDVKNRRTAGQVNTRGEVMHVYVNIGNTFVVGR